MIWFLRLFPAYAEALAKVAALEEKCRLLDEQKRMADARVGDLQKTADAAWRQATGRSMFTGLTDMTPPSVEPPRPIMGTRRLGRELQMESTTATMAALRQLLDDDKVA